LTIALMKRFQFMAMVALVGLMVVVGANAATAPGQKPNFLIILADDLGYSDLGCYGGEISTPHLDSLAKNGLRFTQFYNTARCWPSRASLLTGYYAQQVRRDAVPGIKSGGGGVRPSWAPLVTEFLRPAGYRTYHSGKWHIDSKPLNSGFDRSYDVASPGQNNFFLAEGNTEEGKPAEQSKDYYVTSALADHAINCLREHAASYPEKPFFHYLAFTAPHFPLHAPAEDIAKYRDRYKAGWNVIASERHDRLRKLKISGNRLPAMEPEVGPPYAFPADVAKLGPDEVTRPIPWNDLTPSQQEFQATKMAIHAAMVDRMDREIGRVLAQLKEMGAYDNTLIVFASDNGASAEIMVRGRGHDPHAPMGSMETFLCLGPGWSSACNTPFRRHKTWVHEGGISTPFIVHWPAGIRTRGQLRHTPGHFIDLVPTVLEISGLQKPAVASQTVVPPAPGRSLLPIFQKDRKALHEFVWFGHDGHRALRAGDWKIVALKNGDWELYNLQKDRGEERNLAAEQPEKLRQLQALWTAQDDENRRLALGSAR
jgi:arylsulfatase A-like enzyme